MKWRINRFGLQSVLIKSNNSRSKLLSSDYYFKQMKGKKEALSV